MRNEQLERVDTDTPLMELVDCYAISAMAGNAERASELRAEIERRVTSRYEISDRTR